MFVHYFVFIFVVYNIIYRRKATLVYSLFIKIKLWTRIEELIKKLTYSKLIVAFKKIKKTNKWTNLAILILE